MQSALSGLLDRPRIVIADEDHPLVEFMVQTLRTDGKLYFMPTMLCLPPSWLSRSTGATC